MGDTTYPPQPWIHERSCPDAPAGLIVFKASVLNDVYPLGRPHHCVDRLTVTHNRDVVAESAGDEPHPYVESTIWPEDATGPLCATCRGSHPESAAVAQAKPRPAYR